MYSGGLEIQATRKALAVLQDEANRILNAARDLLTLPEMIIVSNKSEMRLVIERIGDTEDKVETLRRKITREVADMGRLMANRENLLNTAYEMDEIAGYITDIAFKLSNVKGVTLKKDEIKKDLSELIDQAVNQIQKINEIVRTLGGDTAVAIDLAYEAQKIERIVDRKYRTLTITALDKVTSTKELMLLKDIIEGIEEMADKCLDVSDSFVLLALNM